MSRGVRRAVAGAVLSILLIGVATACGGDDPGELRGIVRSRPLEVGQASVTEVTNGQAPAPFFFRAQPGELLIAYFGYTNCPDVCPTTLATVRSALRELGDDAGKVDLAMVTVDPGRDDGPALDSLLSLFVERYHSLVPQSEDELRAAEAAFLVTSSVTTDASGEIQVEHTGNAFVVDSAGQVVVEWPFGHGKEGMVNDLRVLFGEM